MKTHAKFAVLITIILGTLAWLAVGGVSDAKAYYKTIPEVHAMGGEALTKRLRVAGDVQAGSIQKVGKEVRFTIIQEEKDTKDVKEDKKANAVYTMNVVYTGTDPLPDTFRDVPGMDVGVTVEGELASDDSLEATQVLAKCPSKYEMNQKAAGGEKAPHAAMPPSL